jgi:xylulose-5-phosphate/fructose-6-phosphate phosphoketolase
MGANPIANGGLLRRDLRMPDFRNYAVDIPQPAKVEAENTRPLGALLRDIMKFNMTNFRMFGPDETASNRLQAVYEVSKKVWLAEMKPEDADGSELSADGRVMEMLSEHTLLGCMEGYLLSGRHGFFHTYEAFAHVIDSMFNQHAKWLDISKREIPWRAPVSSWNVMLSSTVWRQDHNGFSHQDPGFVDLVTNKSAEVVRIYFPPDANCCSRWQIIAYAVPTIPMSSCQTNRCTCSTSILKRRFSTAPRELASGIGPATTIAVQSRMNLIWLWLAVETFQLKRH